MSLGSALLMLVASIALCPLVLVMTVVRIFSQKRKLSERLPFLLVPCSALVAVSAGYGPLGIRGLDYTSADFLFGPVAFAGFASTVTYVLLSSALRVLSPKEWRSERIAFLIVPVVALGTFLKEYWPLFR